MNHSIPDSLLGPVVRVVQDVASTDDWSALDEWAVTSGVHTVIGALQVMECALGTKPTNPTWWEKVLPKPNVV
jgi:hypothetical protein